MQINEESILIENRNTRKKNNKEKNIKKSKINDYSLVDKNNFNLSCMLISIISIILFVFFIKKIKSSFFPSSNIILETPYSESNNIINDQSLINELKNIINSFELSPIDISKSIQKNPISKTPQISIIIPVFNNAEKIKLTIHSIQFQNISDIEIIIVDDNSEDNTKQFIEEAQKEDPRIKLLKNQNNKGI